jgi:ribosomal protein L37AE/L43A
MDNDLCCSTCGSEKLFHVSNGVYQCTLCGTNSHQHELIPLEDYQD